MTAPAASCDVARGCRTGMECCERGSRPISAFLNGSWPGRCQPPGPSRSAGRCCWPARPGQCQTVAVPQPDYGARYVAALVLIVEPRSQHRIDPGLVARTLGLTPMESRIAVGLAEGKSVREMAEATGRTPGAITWHLKQIYRRQPISGQVDLVRLVLSLTEFE